jgi:hypothetical protein
MSWAFLLELSLTLPTTEYKRLIKTRAGDHDLPSPLFGFDSDDLETVFSMDRSSSDDAAPKIVLGDLGSYCEANGGALTTEADGDETNVRAFMVLDRGADPWLAMPAAALLHAARPSGTGHLMLFNDGTYTGEDGVLLELSDGEVTLSHVNDCNALVEAVMPAMEGGDLPPSDELLALARG